MFTCAVTQQSSLRGEKPTRLIVETRPREYVFHEDGRECLRPHEGEERCYEEVSKVTQGSEIVKEILISAEGMKLLEKIAVDQGVTQE